MNNGIFAWIRKTHFTAFLIYWVASVFVFTLVYWVLSAIGQSLIVDSDIIGLSFQGFINALYASLLISTIFGIIKISSSSILSAVVYLQFALSIILVLIVIDKFLQKYVFPMYHIHHTQDKKLNTMSLTMNIFREDINRLKNEFKSKKKDDVNIKDIESIIDGLYISFLDIDKMFSKKNLHKKHISDRQYEMVLVNVEDSLHVLSKFIDFLTNYKIEWRDKNIVFWINHILDTAEKIVLHFDEKKLYNTKLIISLENVREHVELIRKKL